MQLVKNTVLGLAAVAACLFASQGHSADVKKADKPPEMKTPELSKKAKAVAALSAAYTLARYARENKAPEVLLAAARVVGTTTTTPIDSKSVIEAGKVEKGTLQQEGLALVAEALKMEGAGSDTIKALAKSVGRDISEFKRDREGGPYDSGVRTLTAAAFRGRYRLRFRGGATSIINVHNLSGRGDIELSVRDQSGRIIAHDRRAESGAFVRFVVPTTQPCTVLVVLASRSGTISYRLTTN